MTSPIEVVALFGAGVASFLAPCVLPLVPVWLSVVAGEGADRRRAVAATGVFVAGFAVTFASLGALAGALGRVPVGLEGLLRRGGGLVLVVMGLALLGVLRGALRRERRLLDPSRLPGVGRLRPLVVGIAFGAAWTPCVGPLLAAALTAATASGRPTTGAVLLFAYGLGIGTPFLVVSLWLSSAPGITRGLASWSRWLQPAAGAALVLFGILLLTNQVALLGAPLGVLS